MAENKVLDGKKILAVDDEQDVLDTLVDLLPMCEVAKASSFEEAQKLLESQHFDLVILDMIMPKMGGKEVFRMMRSIDPKAKVLLTSGYVDEDRIRNLLDDGAIGFLKKPYNETILRQAIERALTD